MSSRGSAIKNGHVTSTEYETLKTTQHGVKILKGLDNNHSLPDFAHTPNSIYAKMKYYGETIHEMRFYDKNGYPIIEIAYHPEPKINAGNREKNIVHFHTFTGVNRNPHAYRMDKNPDIKEKYKIYLKEFKLYDKC